MDAICELLWKSCESEIGDLALGQVRSRSSYLNNRSDSKNDRKDLREGDVDPSADLLRIDANRIRLYGSAHFIALQHPDHVRRKQSELIAVESARTIDRLRLQGALTVEEAAGRQRAITDWLEAIDLVLVRAPVLRRASDPLPTPLGTLEAIHPATALIRRERMGALPTMATHDTALGLAARAFGFDVHGI